MTEREAIEHGRRLLLEIGGNCEESWQQNDKTFEVAAQLAEALARVVGRPEYDEESGDYRYSEAFPVPPLASRGEVTRSPDWVAIAADLFDEPDALNIEEALRKAFAAGQARGSASSDQRGSGVGEGAWVKCSERMPEELQPVLVVESENATPEPYVAFREDDEWHVYTSPFAIRGPIHWMPLPAPPATELATGELLARASVKNQRQETA